MLPRLRPVLDALPAYKAGKPAQGDGGISAFKLSSNENHHLPLPSVLRAAEEALADLHRYPDFASTALVEAIARHFGVLAADVAVGTGSVGLLQQLVQITSGPGDGVLYAWRSFEAYPIVTLIAGANPQQVPLDANDRHDLDSMLAAVDETTRIIMVCNPNNPTSTAVDRASLASFIEQVPSDILIVLDEAYREFVDEERIPDGLEFYRKYENVAVLRTFSKAYGLAALRVGFCIAHEPVAEALRKVQVPFGVSTIAQAAAIASLGAEAELLDRVSSIVHQRAAMVDQLQSQGIEPAESEANFLWLRLGDDAVRFAEACAAQGISVRPFAGEGVRVTVGEPEANERFVQIASAWVNR